MSIKRRLGKLEGEARIRKHHPDAPLEEWSDDELAQELGFATADEISDEELLLIAYPDGPPATDKP